MNTGLGPVRITLILVAAVSFGCAVFGCLAAIGLRINVRVLGQRVRAGFSCVRPSIVRRWAEHALRRAWDDPASLHARHVRMLCVVLCGGTGWGMSGRALFGLISAVAAYAAMDALFIRRSRTLKETFESSLAAAVRGMAGGMRAGRSLQQALEHSADAHSSPAAAVFREVLAQVRLGVPLAGALQAVADRRGSDELLQAVTLMRIAGETGGDLPGILDAYAGELSAREAFRGKVRALTAQGKASGMVMSAVPVLLLFILYALEPSMTGLLFTTTPGNLMLLAAALMIACGAYIMRRIVDIPL